MASPDEEGLKGNKKGRPVWAFVKNASLAVTMFLFFLTIVLVLDAYKFVSVRHAKFARKKLLRTLQYMDPSIIEAHTGMKVLTKKEFDDLQSDLEKARTDVREMNTKVQEKFSDVLKTSMELQNMKQDIDELKKLIAEKEGAKAKEEEEAKKKAEEEAKKKIEEETKAKIEAEVKAKLEAEAKEKAEKEKEAAAPAA